LLAPRGMGTMFAMFLVGRLIRKVDIRVLIFCGLIFTAIALHTMSGFTLDVGRSMIVFTGVLQGLGFGFVFVPLSTVTFSTLAARLRTEGTAIYSLMRNIGSSIGISIVVTLLARNTQINHASLAAICNPFRLNSLPLNLAGILDTNSSIGQATLNLEVTKQAATISYLNDFALVMWLTIAAIPLVFLFQMAKK
jgi:MFS transporter, DHA2 family, multidrug resistance protein